MERLSDVSEHYGQEMIRADVCSHDGLARGLSHFNTCRQDEEQCNPRPPKLVRYDGYKHLQEDPTDIVQCIGPRGVPINESDEDAVWAYPGIAAGMCTGSEPPSQQLTTIRCGRPDTGLIQSVRHRWFSFFRSYRALPGLWARSI